MPARNYTSPVSDDAIAAVFDSTAQLKATTVLRLLGLRRSRQRIIDAQLRRLSRPPQQRLVEVSPPAIAVHRNPFYRLAAAAARTPAVSSPTPDSIITGNSNDGSRADITRDDKFSLPLLASRIDDECRSAEHQRVMPLTTADNNTEDHGAVKEIDPSLQAPSSPSAHPPSRPPCSVCHSVDATVVFLPCKHQLSCPACWESAKKRQRSIHSRKERLRMELADAGVQRVRFQAHCLWCQQGVQEEIHPFVS